MEVEPTTSPEYDKAHPNYERWRRAREISLERAKFVKSVVSNFIECKNLRILDIGSGEGNTVETFAQDNFVVSIEKNRNRLLKQINKSPELLILGDAVNLPVKKKTMDLIILQDSLEHLKLNENFFGQLHQLLRDKGIVYLSTPNKYSLLNFISDPHWGLPVVSLLRKKNIKKYFLKYFRKKDYLRDDIAELWSLYALRESLGEYFMPILNTEFATKELFKGNKGLIWSNFHLGLLKLAHSIRLKKFFIKIANDKEGFLNNFITPTFYLVLVQKK